MSAGNETTGVHLSGVAARLSGVPVDTLRIWERRYSVIGPRLSAGRQRLYSLADIRRLTTIKQLVDLGHPIGTIASLGTPIDITANELRIETYYPVDDATAAWARAGLG